MTKRIRITKEQLAKARKLHAEGKALDDISLIIDYPSTYNLRCHLDPFFARRERTRWINKARAKAK